MPVNIPQGGFSPDQQAMIDQRFGAGSQYGSDPRSLFGTGNMYPARAPTPSGPSSLFGTGSMYPDRAAKPMPLPQGGPLQQGGLGGQIGSQFGGGLGGQMGPQQPGKGGMGPQQGQMGPQQQGKGGMPPMQQQPQQGKGGMPPSIQQNLAGRTQPGKGGLPQGGYMGGPNGPQQSQISSVYGGMRPGG